LIKSDVEDEEDSSKDEDEKIKGCETSYGDVLNEGFEDQEDPAFIKWQQQTLPFQPRSKYGLSPESALLLDYFNLFIPLFFWSKFANYRTTKQACKVMHKEGVFVTGTLHMALK
jgi:hypothetical protein